MDCNVPYEFIGPGAMNGHSPYEFIGSGTMDGNFQLDQQTDGAGAAGKGCGQLLGPCPIRMLIRPLFFRANGQNH